MDTRSTYRAVPGKSHGALAFGLALTIAARVAAGAGELTPAQCAGIEAGGLIVFQGRTLLETPDILAPQLRRANALLTARCFAQAEALRDEFVAAHPDDFHVAFVSARELWLLNRRPRAQSIITIALQLHPEFASAMVLLASMNLDDQNFAEAQALLDKVDKQQPTDMWAYVDRLRMEAALVPTASTVRTLRAILENREFPQSVREQALQIARYGMPGLSDKERDALFAAAMADGACDACALTQQALELIELRNDARAGAQLIEQYMRQCGGCVATTDVRTLLAEAYLLEAAAAAGAGAPQATLVRQAKEALGGDLTLIARRAAARPFMAPAVPLLAGSVDHSATDEHGETVICTAVRYLNPQLVREELDDRADPNGSCPDASLLMSVLYKATRAHVQERQDIARMLLERGARVEGLEFCASRDNGDCSQVLLPILQGFESERSRSRRDL